MPTAGLTARLEQLFEAYRRDDAPGCVVGVAQRGELVYRAAFGMANVEHRVANTPATRMPLASITKHITCVAVLRLAADGLLDLDQPIGRWITELPEIQQRPTLRQLMSHSGGLRCYIDHAVFDGFSVMPAGRPAALQTRLTEVNFPPGQGMAYSNAGYLLLTWAIERVTGKPLEEVLRTGLFAEAWLQETWLPRSDLAIKPGVATTYQRTSSGAWQHSAILAEELFGDAGIISTVDDMLRWAAYLRANHLDTKLAAPTSLENGLESRYGLGLITKPWRGLNLIHHAGTFPGVTGNFLMVREEELDVIVMFNRPAPAVDLSQKIASVLLGDRLQATPAFVDDIPRLHGQYVSAETGVLLGLSEKNGSLALSQFGGAAVPLEQHPPYFGFDAGSGDMLFRTRPGTEDLQYMDRSGWHVAQRINGAPMTPAEAVLAAPDSYYSDCARATLRFVAKNTDNLEVVIAGEYGVGHYPAASVGPDLIRFWAPGLAPGMLIRFERDAGVVKRVIVSTPRTRATAFSC
jgi:D-aminopeptidase